MATLMHIPMRLSYTPNLAPKRGVLQQFVDERASEHVEKTGSNPSMDA